MVKILSWHAASKAVEPSLSFRGEHLSHLIWAGLFSASLVDNPTNDTFATIATISQSSGFSLQDV
jgi:hypothetical protein